MFLGFRHLLVQIRIKLLFLTFQSSISNLDNAMSIINYHFINGVKNTNVCVQLNKLAEFEQWLYIKIFLESTGYVPGTLEVLCIINKIEFLPLGASLSWGQPSNPSFKVHSMYMHVLTDITCMTYHYVNSFWEIYGGDI